MDAETLLELADSLPNKLVYVAISAMDLQQRQYFKDVSQYSNEQIGHWLSHDVLVLPLNAKARDALRLIRRDVAKHTDCIFLLNRTGQFAAAIKLTSIFGSLKHVQLV